MNPEALLPRFQARLSHVGLSVSIREADQLARYYELLALWNRRINLTALPLDGFPAATLDRLLVEPLVAAAALDTAPRRWADVGSGGGSPAIPMAVRWEGTELILVESREKKASFLREIVRQLRFERARVTSSRFEDRPDREQDVATFDLVTLRGVRLEPDLREAVRDSLRPGGALMAFGAAVESLDGFRPPQQISLPGGSRLQIFVRYG